MKSKEIRTIWLEADERPLHEVVNDWLEDGEDREIVQLRVIDYAGQQPPGVFIIYRLEQDDKQAVGFAARRPGSS